MISEVLCNHPIRKQLLSFVHFQTFKNQKWNHCCICSTIQNYSNANVLLVIVLKSFFIFQFQLTYNIVLVSGVHPSDETLRILQSDHPDTSRTHLTPNVVTRLLTVLPVLYFSSPRMLRKTPSYVLIPSLFAPPLLSCPSGNCQNVFCIFQSVSIQLIHFDF